MPVARYMKKPIVISAIQWNGNNLDEIMNFCRGNANYELMSKGTSELVISTLEDGKDREVKHIASLYDFIIRGVQGEYYPCKPDIFDQTYECVNE